jgi:glycosyltransferase involved in cell wall biosynthesis
MKIAIISTSGKKYGGKIYEKMVAETLFNSFEIEFVNIGVKGGKFKYFKIPLILWRLFRFSQRKDLDFIIKDFEASLFLNKKPVKNIALIHHIDYSYAPLFLKFIYPFFKKIIFSNLKKFNAFIVVSRYWESYFKERGYKNVYRIYNGFDLSNFDISDQELLEFKKKFNLLEKPIIYLGNCQKAKGVVESYRALKDLDVYLVTSGEQMVKIPARNFEVEYKDYLKLLKASSVVLAMSKFKEGWCRTAHEAMLLKTPVIGSDMGGLRELLEGGKQIICEDFNSLREKVEYLLNHSEVRKKMGEDGYNFAKYFTLERFEKEWLNLIKKLSV